MKENKGKVTLSIRKSVLFVVSISHLIRDCDFYEKKMAREVELKKQRVFNTGNEVAKPVWNNANRVNHANHFIPRLVQLIVVRQNVNFVRPNVNTGRTNVNYVRQNVNSVRSNVNTGSFNINTVKAKQPIQTSNSNNFSPVRPQVNKFTQRSHFSKSHSPVRSPIVRNTTKISYTHAVKGNWGTAVKTSAGSSTQKPEDRGYLISGMLRHMTGNKDHLDDFEECKGGSVTFGGSKGYITGKGRIRVEKPNVKGVGYRWMFDVDYLTDSMNYIPVSLENQTNPHAGTLEVTNNAGTLPIPNANAFVGRNEAESLNVVPTAFRHTASKV
ncbi:hypothetical protein Tco_1124054 [Tanacetum coccineum]|uniref:Uncharacterized protein n=1 Tax=Tanacetum coccineum TaxID=301880 RepID=A0ABQ5J5C8_9ASTR